MNTQAYYTTDVNAVSIAQATADGSCYVAKLVCGTRKDGHTTGYMWSSFRAEDRSGHYDLLTHVYATKRVAITAAKRIGAGMLFN